MFKKLQYSNIENYVDCSKAKDLHFGWCGDWHAGVPQDRLKSGEYTCSESKKGHCPVACGVCPDGIAAEPRRPGSFEGNMSNEEMKAWYNSVTEEGKRFTKGEILQAEYAAEDETAWKAKLKKERNDFFGDDWFIEETCNDEKCQESNLEVPYDECKPNWKNYWDPNKAEKFRKNCPGKCGVCLTARSQLVNRRDDYYTVWQKYIKLVKDAEDEFWENGTATLNGTTFTGNEATKQIDAYKSDRDDFKNEYLTFNKIVNAYDAARKKAKDESKPPRERERLAMEAAFNVQATGDSSVQELLQEMYDSYARGSSWKKHIPEMDNKKVEKVDRMMGDVDTLTRYEVQISMSCDKKEEEIINDVQNTILQKINAGYFYTSDEINDVVKGIIPKWAPDRIKEIYSTFVSMPWLSHICPTRKDGESQLSLSLTDYPDCEDVKNCNRLIQKLKEIYKNKKVIPLVYVDGKYIDLSDKIFQPFTNANTLNERFYAQPNKIEIILRSEDGTEIAPETLQEIVADVSTLGIDVVVTKFEETALSASNAAEKAAAEKAAAEKAAAEKAAAEKAAAEKAAAEAAAMAESEIYKPNNGDKIVKIKVKCAQAECSAKMYELASLLKTNFAGKARVRYFEREGLITNLEGFNTTDYQLVIDSELSADQIKAYVEKAIGGNTDIRLDSVEVYVAPPSGANITAIILGSIGGVVLIFVIIFLLKKYKVF